MSTDRNAQRLLDGLWNDFRVNCLPNEHDENKLRYAAMLYFSGALSVLLQLEKVDDDGIEMIARLAAALKDRLIMEEDR